MILDAVCGWMDTVGKGLLIVNRIFIFTLLLALPLAQPAFAQQEMAGIEAHLRALSYHNALGKPIWVHFSIENMTGEPITLTVPDAKPTIPSPEVGLPISHVFSGGRIPSIHLSSEAGHMMSGPQRVPKDDEAPILILGGMSSVGTVIDLREYFPVLRGAGRYRLTWTPYGGATTSDPIVIRVTPLKQAEIVTDEGKLTLRFFYKEAPQTVANFIELASSKFYNGLQFHRIEPGYLIQGGGPRGDGTGIRTDGKRVPAEFNSIPHKKGAVSMALLEGDPESGSCQFFISNTRQKDWDGQYTVFAELVGDASFAVLDRLMALPTDALGSPKRPLYIRSVRIVDAPTDVYPEQR